MSGGSCCAAKWYLSLGNYARGNGPRTLKFTQNYHCKKYISFHFVVNKLVSFIYIIPKLTLVEYIYKHQEDGLLKKRG